MLVSDSALEKLEPGTAEAKKRRFSAKGAPKGMSAYAVSRDRRLTMTSSSSR